MIPENTDPRCKATTSESGTPCGALAVATATQGGRSFAACQADATRAKAAGYLVTLLDRTDDPAPR